MYKNGLGVDQCFKTAFWHLKFASDMGHLNACAECGDLMYSGKGCLWSDKTKAYEFYERGSVLGSAWCMNLQALLLEQGFDAQMPDLERAVELYQKAGMTGSSDAFLNLGLLVTIGGPGIE